MWHGHQPFTSALSECGRAPLKSPPRLMILVIYIITYDELSADAIIVDGL